MKRRVNTKFLLIVTLAFAGLFVGGFVMKRFFFKPRPEQAMQRAAAANDKNWELAAREYERAYLLSYPKNAEILVMQGDALSNLTQQDTSSYGRDQRSYRRALEVDPKNKTAMQRMLKAYADQIE